MLSIKVIKIEFRLGFLFRKFKNLIILLVFRIMLLCGYNGVGKLIILGLVFSFLGFI